MMRTESGLMQTAQGVMASMGGVSGQPVPAEGAVFAALFSDPPPRPGEEDQALPLAEAGGNVWPLIAPVSGLPLPGGVVLMEGFSGVRVNAAAANEMDPGLAAGGSRPLSAPPLVALAEGEGLANAHMDGVETSTLPVPGVVPVVGGALAPLGETYRVTEGPPKDGPVTKAQAFPSPAGAVDGLVPDPSKLDQSGKALSSSPDGFVADSPSQARGAGGEMGAIPAGPASPAIRALPAESGLPAQRAVPPVPAVTSGPSSEGAMAANDGPAPPAALLSDQGREQVIAPDETSPTVDTNSGVAPSARQVATEGERVWLGRLHWQGVPGDETEGTARNSMPFPAELVGTHALRAAQDSRLAGLSQAALHLATIEATELEQALTPLEPDPQPLGWSSAGLPALTGSTVSGPLITSAVPQLAAAMVATLHQKPDGTTEIALSPDELGSVRLRLEADARDPDRMIVHLVFDRPETMDLFRRHADQLAEAIRAAGYAEARLDFGQSGGGADPQGGKPPDTAQPPANLTDGDQPLVKPIFDPPHPSSLADMAGLDLRL